MLDHIFIKRCVDILMRLPATETFRGRSTLLTGLPNTIDLYLHSDQKGPFIGRGGGLVKSLQSQFNIGHLSFWSYNNGNPREL